MNLWMPGVERVETTAQGGYGDIKPIAIVNHIMQGYQTTMVNWAKQRPSSVSKSAHFTIGRKGRTVQHVPINNASWASGNVRVPTWALLRYNNGKVLNPNSYIINIEHEGFSKDPVQYPFDYIYDSSSPWPEAMVAASIEVQQWVCDELGITPTLDTITGHFSIDSLTRADDPGKAWPQERIIRELTSGKLPPPVNKMKAYYAIAAGGAKPIRVEGSYGVYELKVKI